DVEAVADREQRVRIADPSFRADPFAGEAVEAPAEPRSGGTSCVVFVRDPVAQARVQRGNDDNDVHVTVAEQIPEFLGLDGFVGDHEYALVHDVSFRRVCLTHGTSNT